MTGAVGWLTRRHLRRRWPALVPVALIVAAGATGAFIAAGAADRTAGAYGDYLTRARVSDVTINPSLSTTEIDQVIRTLPGVRSVTSEGFFLADFADDGAPRTVAEGQADQGGPQVRGSSDGRYHDMDRPALVAGRLPTGHDEAMVSRELADAEGIELGDTYPVSFWGRVEGTTDHPDFSAPDTVISPVGVEHLTVVGIGTLSDEVLPEELYPRDRVVVSPDVVERYDCLIDLPPQDATDEEAFLASTPGGCATSYRYYSLEVEGGADGVAAVTEAFRRRAEALNAGLPPVVLQQAQYHLIATTTAQEQARVERSTQPTVAALAVLAGVAAAVTLVVAGLAAARELRRSEDDLAQWRQLGLTTGERVRVVAVPLAGAVVAGLLMAVVAAWLLSPIGPVGSVRSVEPSPDRRLSTWASLGAVALGLVLVAGVVALGLRSAGRGGRAHRLPAVAGGAGAGGGGGGGRAPSARQRLVQRATRPEVAEGVRAAQGGYRGAGLVMASGGVAAAIFLAAVVFGASLSSVVSTPADYGWPWDVATMGGFGYGGVDLDQARDELDGRADVERWTGLGFTNQVTLDGDPVLSVIGYDRTSTVDLPVVAGRLPTAAGEVALGSLTAADQGLAVGDRVELGGDALPDQRPTAATVVGLVVMPPLGPYQADRAAPGRGLLLPEAMFPADFLAANLSFVGVELTGGARPGPVLAELRPRFQAWETHGWVPFNYRGPVRPAEIDDAGHMRAVPLLAGGLLVVAAVIGLALAVIMSVRGRRRELAILRALGFTGRQLRTSVRVQALVTMTVALAVGVPVGVALGRLAWRAFADQLGVAAGPVVPLGWLAATVAGGLTVALVAAALPARTASRIDPATTLRSE
ncbi:MAG TPA: ABC transporter permease [Acidimicrobiales bacterium]|nr:ABC transporter permease [Acidimicrobiales bacterium]